MSFFSNLSTLFAAEQAKQKSDQKKAQVKEQKQEQSQVKKPSQVSKVKVKESLSQAQPKVQQQPNEKIAADVESIIRDARSKAREIIIEAKDEVLEMRSKAEKESRRIEHDLAEQQRTLQNKLDKLDYRFDQIEQKEKRIDQLKEDLVKQSEEIEKSKAQVLKKLEELSGYSKEEAKEYLLEGLKKKLSHDLAKLVAEKEEQAKLEADDKAREILIDAMRHGATDYVAEYTVSVVNIPSEEIKGKIIGKNGRNIHAFERKTGVDIDLDTSNTEIKLSSFDPVRREIARVAMERLIKDGRIQPTRIEEIVDKVTEEIDRITFDAGKKLCHEVGVYNIPNGLIAMLGKFKYRFSYGQNLIKHTIEETKIGSKIAQELGLDVNTVKLGCLLHDIGKVSDDPDENHVQAGIRIAKKYNMPPAVIACIAEHHEDQPFSSPESVAVYIADAISGARPGARYENHEEYMKRMETLEAIATSYDEVKRAYAVQAGRELRVILIPEKSKDDDVILLANSIRDRVAKEVIVPGTVTVTVIRELRGQAQTK
ncbi:ribonuclease Y [Candidatus Woesebacteria bacterium]|jgi:ribonuclease Y|nr:ribonuclease Y [Candidatus Woesebacteria bacterium]HNV44882.1 ribonuclease Y [Candidatus Woesebacteria bacterium]HOA11804.1 ribonuclease Y [Candidatus Woesebacteria bacterium]HOC07258.1 ribonuclease Y [Candidatus Woesebacteria bacterium]HOP39017.1 ribonuclease Y [Candidatus Woesebacteria bacterium]